MSQERNTLANAGTTTVVADLLGRPLTARSIIASLLLGMHPPRLSSARLVRWCSLFGVGEGTARVALSRMVERGELTASGGVYELAGAVRRRQASQDWGLEPQLQPWDGTWVIGVVAARARSAPERAALRAAAAAARLAELREGVWVRPDNLPRQAASTEAWDVLDTQCSWWRGGPGEQPGPPGGPAELAEQLFAATAWSARAEALAARLEDLVRALEAGRDGALASGFVTGAAGLQHIHRDPLLPPELLAPAWPGARLRSAYEEYRVTYGHAVAAWFAARD